MLPRSVGSGELAKARKGRHTRNKSDGEAIMSSEMRFRQQVGQTVEPEAMAAAAASPPPPESAEQKRLRERLNISLVEVRLPVLFVAWFCLA
jgi:hypothetical protein